MSEKWLKRFMLNCSGDLSEFFGKKIISGHFCVFSGLFPCFCTSYSLLCSFIGDRETLSNATLEKRLCKIKNRF